MSAPPVSLGPFHLGEEIGRGGMGTVFRAVHSRQGVSVAVKVVSAARARDAQYREAFLHEVRAVASLDHPTIVMVLDQGIVDATAAAASGESLIEGSPYLVMELLDQGSLRERRPTTWPALRRVLVELLDALAHAHARGFIHRDIKPSNVMLAATGGSVVRLTDFGIAHALDDVAAFRGASVTGTPHYMAPEQVRAELRELGPWTDLYAVGCLAYRLSSGHPPFFERGLEMAEVMLRQLESPMPPLRSQLSVPPGFSKWIETLLAKEPGLRFQRAADAVAALLDLPDVALPSVLPSAPLVEDEEVTVGADTTRDERSSDTAREDSAPEDSAPEDSAPEDSAPPTVYTVAAASVRTSRPPVPSRPPSSIRPDVPVAPFPSTWRSQELPRRSTALLGAGLGLYGLRPIPMVDRESEREALWSALAEVHRERRPQVRVLRGQSGVGKSRLAQWLAHRAHEVGAAEILVATHDAAASPASGLAPMVARVLRTRGCRRAEALALTLDQVRSRGGSVDDAVAITELSHPRAAEHTDDGPRVRLASPRERYVAHTRLLELLGADRPVLLWLDDAQWGLEAIELAAHLAELPKARTVPVLVVLTIRDETLEGRPLESARLETLMARPDTAIDTRVDTLDVQALAPADHELLVARLLGLSGPVAKQVCERTLGNPLFAVHLVGDWVQRGVLVAAEEGFELADGVDASIPDDLHTLWIRRLDPVVESAEDWLALELAAVLGHRVDAKEHARACAAAGVEPAPRLLAELVLRGLAHEEPGGFAFAHGMLLESLCRHNVDAGREVRVHLACADALAASPGRGVSERVARHLESAGERIRSLEPMLEATHERARASEYDKALALLERYEESASELPADDPRRARGWIERAMILLRRALPKEAEPYLERAEAGVSEHGWEELRADVLHARAKFAQMSGLVREAIASFEQALILYEADSNARGVARCRHGVASMLTQSGRREEAVASFEAALESYREADDEFGRTHCLLGLSNVLLESDRARGLAALEEARVRAEADGYRLGVAIVHLHLGFAHRYEGRLDEAEESFERSAAILAALESTDVGVPRQNIGVLHLMRSDFPAARAVFEASYEEMREAGRDGYLAFTHSGLLPCYASAREWSRFDAHCAAAEACIERSGLVDTDLEFAIRKAGDLAEEAGETNRAARAHRLADDQKKALGSQAD